MLYSFLSLAGPVKHQRILQVSLETEGMLLDPSSGVFIPGPAVIGGQCWSAMRNELDFLRIPIRPDYKANFQPKFKIVLKEGEPPFEASASVVLRKMVGQCRSIVHELKELVTVILN